MSKSVKINLYKKSKKHSLELDPEHSILDGLIQNNIEISHSCGGMGTCGTCVVKIKNYQLLPQRDEIEKEKAEDLNYSDNERLACQNFPLDNLSIEIP